jgi:hypothetical protein
VLARPRGGGSQCRWRWRSLGAAAAGRRGRMGQRGGTGRRGRMGGRGGASRACRMGDQAGARG